MKGTLHREIRALLRESPEPLSILEISNRTNAQYTSVQRCLTKVMDDAYIKAWCVRPGYRPTKLWAVAVVPPDAPFPIGTALDLPAAEPRTRPAPKAARTPPTPEALRKKHSKQVQESKARAKVRRERPLQGLTVIRGPWPTHA